MIITFADNRVLDMFVEEEPSMNITVSPVRDITQRSVTYTSEFDVPMTDKNKELIDPRINNTNEFNVDVVFDNGNEMSATLYVEASNSAILRELYAITLVDNIVKKMEFFDNGIEELLDTIGHTDDFKWRFRNNVADDIPTDVTDDWFISTANFNGTQYDNVENGMPVYVNKYINGKSQLFFTMSFYNFINTALYKSAISSNLLQSDEIMDGVRMDELYVYIPINPVSEDSRDMEFNWDGSKIYPVTDSLNQLTITANKITGMTDTLYDITISGNATINITHKETVDSSCSNTPLNITPTSGEARLLIYLLLDDTVLETIDTGTALNINENPVDTTVVFNETLRNVELLATGELSLRYAIIYDNYTFEDTHWFYDPNDGCEYLSEGSVVLNQVNIIGGEPLAGFLSPYVSPPKSKLMLTLANVVFDSTKNISPALGYNGEIGEVSFELHEETINMPETLKKTELTIKEILNGILNRFNLIVYTDSNGLLNIKNEQNRYTSDIVSRIISEKDGYKSIYTNDFIGEFSYKNKETGIINNQINLTNIGEDDTSFSSGDVLLYKADGDVDDNIQLSTSVGIKNIYGEYIGYSDEEGELLDNNSDEQYWGLSVNEQLDTDDIGVLHGFISSAKITPDIRMPIVKDIIALDPLNIQVTYQKDAGIEPGTANVSMYYPIAVNSSSESLYLGDENGNIDTNSTIYWNFFELLNIRNGNYITVNKVLDKNELNSIIDGDLIDFIDENGEVYTSKVSSINGVMVDQEYSVVELNLIRNQISSNYIYKSTSIDAIEDYYGTSSNDFNFRVYSYTGDDILFSSQTYWYFSFIVNERVINTYKYKYEIGSVGNLEDSSTGTFRSSSTSVKTAEEFQFDHIDENGNDLSSFFTGLPFNVNKIQFKIYKS